MILSVIIHSTSLALSRDLYRPATRNRESYFFIARLFPALTRKFFNSPLATKHVQLMIFHEQHFARVFNGNFTKNVQRIFFAGRFTCNSGNGAHVSHDVISFVIFFSTSTAVDSQVCYDVNLLIMKRAIRCTRCWH